MVERGGLSLLSLRLRTYPSAAQLCRIPAGGTRRNVFIVTRQPPEASDYLFAMDGLGMMKLVHEPCRLGRDARQVRE